MLAYDRAVVDVLTVDPPAAGGFSWLNLVILLVVAAVAWALYRRARDWVSRHRRDRWAREEEQGTVFTPENDPDLRRDDDLPRG